MIQIYAPDGSWWYVPGGPVSLLNLSNDQTGVSSTTWTTNLNGATSASYQVYAYVGNDYYGYGYATLTASMPSVGQASGAGALTMGNSAGLYAADSGSLLNFNLTARDLSGDTKGSLTITFVRTDANGRKHTYQVQSTAVTSYGSDAVLNLADIAATANLSDLTDPLHPILIASGLQLDVTLSDRGSPGSNDSVGFSLWGNGMLYFSSDWSGTGTAEDRLRNGNLVVH